MVYPKTKLDKNIGAKTACLAFFLLTCVVSACGQMTVGDNLTMRMSGSLGYSYSGMFGNSGIQSSHGQGLSANGTLDGYYFNPNFLTFNVRPYFDRSQANDESQSITRGSGIGSSVGLFGGSRFPGSISYGRDFSSNSEFQVAGVPSVLGNSSGESFGISWDALVPGLPQFYANYFVNDSAATLLTSTNESKSSSRNFTLNSTYRIVGFDLQGNFNHIDSSFLSPEFLTGTTVSNSGSGTSYGISAQHRLPLSGSLGLGWSQATYGGGDNSDSTTTAYSAGAGIAPFRRLSVNETWSYTTNLVAALGQSLMGGESAPLLRSDAQSDAMYMSTISTLSVGHGFNVSGHFNHRIQHFQGHEYADSQYGGTFNFRQANRILGFLYFSVGAVDTATQEGNGGVGLVANLGMTHKFGRWETAADFSYSQNVQTLLAIATTSNYNFGGSVRRKINADTHWNATFREARSGLVMQKGSDNSSESYSTSLSWRKYAFSGSYSQSRGAALLSSTGALTATPLGSLISNDFLVFDARSIAFNASTRLFRRVSVSGGYANVASSTTQNQFGAFNNGDRFNVRADYRLRRFSVAGGFDRAMQEVSTLPGGPRVVNSYYLSLSRWFNVF